MLRQKCWLIKTNSGFIDRCRYKTITALDPTRNYFWKTEQGARTAFETIQDRFPKLGPKYELWEGIIAESYGCLYAAPVAKLESK